MLAKHVVCLVRRDMAEIIPITVFEHEVDIIRDIHGDANVELVDSLPDCAPVDINAAIEMDRLIGCYGMNDAGQLYAERVYGRSYKGLEAHGYVKKGRKKGPVEEAIPAESDN